MCYASGQPLYARKPITFPLYNRVRAAPGNVSNEVMLALKKTDRIHFGRREAT